MLTMNKIAKTLNPLLAAIAFGLAFTGSLVAGEEKGVVVPETEASAFSTFIKDTRPFLNGRLRYEWADIQGYEDSHLVSLRNRFGIETGELMGFSFLAEGEHNWVLSPSDKYNAFPGTGSKRSLIADPDNIELNRLQLSYSGYDSNFVAGRQEILIDDHRFVGNVGWRQNEQTYDALFLQNQSVKDLKLTYGYIDRVNRIFGEQAPSPALTRFESDSHIIHIEYAGWELGKIRGFGYLLDLGDDSGLASKSSTNTFGLEFQGTRDISGSGLSCTYLFTAAYQENAASNPIDYHTGYYRAEVGLKNGQLNGGFGLELLNSDDGRASFQTPLATLHKFNGFADAFLSTPVDGLHDYYAWVGTVCPLKINHKLILHYFTTDEGGDALGWEIDYVAKRKITKNFSALLKLAFLDGQGGQGDISRISLEADYSF